MDNCQHYIQGSIDVILQVIKIIIEFIDCVEDI